MDKVVIAVLIILAIAVVLFGGGFILSHVHGEANARIGFNNCAGDCPEKPATSYKTPETARTQMSTAEPSFGEALNKLADATVMNAETARTQAQALDRLSRQLEQRPAPPAGPTASPACITDCGPWTPPAPPQ